MLVHGQREVAPVQRLAEGWPLCLPLLRAGMGWFSPGRNEDGALKVWADNGRKGIAIDLKPSSLSDFLKPWMMRVHDDEL